MDRADAVRGIAELSSAGKRSWISTIKSELNESTLASNVVIGMLLVGLEKLVELEFACPCNPNWNRFFVSVYFVCPAVIVIGMNVYQKKSLPNIALPAIMWIILLFLDGKYYACAKTNWSGRFVIIDKAAPQKWCEPTNSTSSQELMIKTQQWFFHSQLIGISVMSLSAMVLGLYKFKKTRKQQAQDEEMSRMYNPVKISKLTCLQLSGY